ncbi:MAG: hypothetical protein ACJ77N_06335, partial [Chloroflexota bacterium]
MRTEPSDSNPAAAQDGAALPGAVAPDGDTTRGTDPASAAAPPSRRTALLRSGLIVTVLVIVFVVILPRYIDYADVAAAFQDLTAQQFVLMTALGILAW